MKLVLVKIQGDKREVVATGDRKKLNNRLKELRTSTQRGAVKRNGMKYKVTYKIEEENEQR
jgi:hypothetical protein